eukprot:9651-Prymnesium_polylepis.2
MDRKEANSTALDSMRISVKKAAIAASHVSFDASDCLRAGFFRGSSPRLLSSDLDCARPAEQGWRALCQPGEFNRGAGGARSRGRAQASRSQVARTPAVSGSPHGVKAPYRAIVSS